MDKIRVGKSGSGSYEKFHKVLEEGAKLGVKTSVRDMANFLERFAEAAENYRNSHDSLLGPVTKDGEKRLEQSKNMKSFSKDTAEELKRVSKGLGEKSVPIGLKIMNTSASLEEVKKKRAEQEVLKAQQEALKNKQAKPEEKEKEQAKPAIGQP